MRDVWALAAIAVLFGAPGIITFIAGDMGLAARLCGIATAFAILAALASTFPSPRT